jgi:excisionase family DNA binding protein
MPLVDEKLYTPREVAEYLRVDTNTIYRWLRDGKLGGAKIGRDYRISESQLRAFLEERSTGPEA